MALTEMTDEKGYMIHQKKNDTKASSTVCYCCKVNFLF